MTSEGRQKGEEQQSQQPFPAPEPWWAGLGATGGIVLAVVGLAGLAWLLLGLPGSQGEVRGIFYQCAKVAAIGLVVAGTTLYARRRDKSGKN
ncbi:hypothetical protein ACTPOK_07240 [Streptomyces inhibens]|uniref:hypothetical protein n=1 Tax=Streptomyces inhibens TaxID=2293571 RepID=UPI00402AA16D